MKVLMVGPGAVGQVLGLHLRRAGVEPAFYARPRSAERLRRALKSGGLPVTATSHRHRRRPVEHRLDGYAVVTDIAESRRFAPDQIWFATPSTVFTTDWFREFLAAVPAEQIILFAPEGNRRELALPDAVRERTVFGGITFTAWQGDLGDGGGRPGGVTYWMPPGASIPLMGEGAAVQGVAQVMAAGGLRAVAKGPEFQAMQGATTALLSALAVGLEQSAWSFKRLRRGQWLAGVAQCAQEAIATQLVRPGAITRGLLRIALSPAILYAASLVLPRFTPFDLERYMQFHYTKTRDQTMALLDLFIRDGVARGLPVEGVRAMREAARSQMAVQQGGATDSSR